MTKRDKKKTRKPSGIPKIQRIIAASGPKTGEVIKSAPAGTILRIVGNGFGRRPNSVRICFNGLEYKPYKLPFSDTELMVTAPLPTKSTANVRLCVGRRWSNRVRFTVTRTQKTKKQVGMTYHELFEAIDQLAGLTAAFARKSTYFLEVDQATRETMLNAAESLDGYRMVGLRVVETWMQWLPYQAEQTFEPLRTIEFYDEAIQVSGATERVNSAIQTVYGSGGPVQQLIPGAPESLFVSTVASNASTASTNKDSFSLVGSIGFILHEITKTTEGVENLVKVLKPSAEAGASVGAQGSIDAEFSPGDLISAIAKILDVVAQILIKISESGSTTALNLKITGLIEGVQRLEGKADREGNQIGTLIEQSKKQNIKLDKLEAKSDTLGITAQRIDQTTLRNSEKLDITEGKLDRLEVKSDTIGATSQRIDQTTLRNSEKLDILEVKADRAEVKLDQLMVVTSYIRQKVDILIANVQRVEAKIDVIQQDVSFIRSEVTTIHGHVDQLLIDSQTIQNRLNAIQGQLVNIGRGVGDLGNKVDGVQNDVDNLRTTVDEIADRIRLIDRKVDRLVAQIP